MSADNAVFVQKNKADKFVGQYGSMSSDTLPDPEKARPEEIFHTLDELIEKQAHIAADTEYGFNFFINFKEQPGYGTVDYTSN